MKGTLITKEEKQTLFRKEGEEFVPVSFNDLKKEDQIKVDLTQKDVYIATSDYYNMGIEVKLAS